MPKKKRGSEPLIQLKSIQRKFVKLSPQDVKLVRELYPRGDIDLNHLNRLLLADESDFPPIRVDKNNVIIDGAHRKSVYAVKRTAKIVAEVLNVSGEATRELAIMLNSRHGLTLTPKQLEDNARWLIFDRKRSQEQAAKVLGVTQQAINYWVGKENKRRYDAQRLEAYTLYHDRHMTQNQIATTMDVPRPTICRWISQMEPGAQGELGSVQNTSPCNLNNLEETGEAAVETVMPSPEGTTSGMGIVETEVEQKIRLEYCRYTPLAEIARLVSTSVEFVEESIKKFLDPAKTAVYDVEPEKLKLFNVWTFGSRGAEHGFDFPGAASGDEMENVLYYFTKPFEVVVDPMAGSGTTLDACKKMNRRCMVYDLEPTRVEIKKWDITKGYAPEVVQAKPKLSFLDPPYYKKFDYVAEHGPIGVSALDRDGFLAFIDKLAKDTYTVLDGEGFAILLISDAVVFDDEKQTILTGEYYRLFKDAGFRPYQHIFTPLSTAQRTSHAVEWAKRERHFLDIGREMFVFKKVSEHG